MNAKELRIGNFIAGLSIEKVEWLGDHVVNLYNIGSYSPVKLTEEWLIKFGFKRVQEDKYGCHYENKECWIYLTQSGFEIEIITASGRFNLSRTYKYVHQLQNLYFAITCKELEVI